MRFVPRKAKVKTEVFRGVYIADVVMAIVGVLLAIALFAANFPYHIYFAIGFVGVWCTLFIPVADDVRLYYGIVLLFRFAAYRKHYEKNPKNKENDIQNIIPFEGINLDKFISFGQYYGMVLEILPMSFFLLNEEKQEYVISTFSGALQRLGSNQKATIIKTRKPMILDDMVKYEDYKYNTLLDMSERGLYTADEVDSRSPVFEERLSAIDFLNNTEKIIKNYYYLVVYDTDREALESTLNGITASLESSQTPIFTRRVEGNQLLVFLKSTLSTDFDERDLDVVAENEKIRWACPDTVKFGVNNVTIDGEKYRGFTISDYPIEVPNAWMYPLFNLDESRVTINISPMDKYKAETLIDKSLIEMEIRAKKDMKSSKKIEIETHMNTLQRLLEGIKNSNENLFNVNVHIMAKESVKKEVRAVLKQNGFKFNENFARQVDTFISSNVSRLDTLTQFERGIQTSTISAMFPFISNALQDERGFYLGYNQYPVFTNFFVRNNERVNSNMMIIGKSGGGKSFATKTLLTNFAADNTRVFILDPENEYEILCHNLGGKMIDVASSVSGIFNPFHIYATLEAEEGEANDAFSGHLQFLEQFFRVILPGITPDAFEVLNTLTVQLYKKKGIDKSTDINSLTAEDFPIFDDLIDVINEKLRTEKDEYLYHNTQIVKTFIEKFATGGRNSQLWNGPTSIKTNENFICFNFRSLISNRNETIANAQMLLVFKYLDGEIIKNRDFNLKYFANEELEEDKRRVVVAVDEAHVFINKKYPIALDFMAQMAKRIRKYSGMQIIITQNIKDFVGTEEIATQSTAIINACQYSLIFGLAPNDMTDLISLYRNAGGINKEEQDSIVTARRGQAFIITGPMNRTTIQIEALNTTKELFQNADYLNVIRR